MFTAKLGWTPRPAEELVADYSVQLDGAEVGKVAQPAEGNCEFDLQFEAGTHEAKVIPNGPYGPGPDSNIVMTPPATGGVTDLKIGNITIVVSATATASVNVGQ